MRGISRCGFCACKNNCMRSSFLFSHRNTVWQVFFVILMCVCLGITATPSGASAEECINPTEGFIPLACVGNTVLGDLYASNPGAEGDLSESLTGYINKIFFFAITIGGILAIMRIAWAGFLYITTDLWSSKGRAKEMLQETVLGLCLLLAVWLILSQINPQILSLKLNFTSPTLDEPPEPNTIPTIFSSISEAIENHPDWYCSIFFSNNVPRYSCLPTLEACREHISASGCVLPSELNGAPPVDVCPNVPGNQTSGPCADAQCVTNGGTWDGDSCDLPPIPLAVTYSEVPAGYFCHNASETTPPRYRCFGDLGSCEDSALGRVCFQKEDISTLRQAEGITNRVPSDAGGGICFWHYTTDIHEITAGTRALCGFNTGLSCEEYARSRTGVVGVGGRNCDRY